MFGKMRVCERRRRGRGTRGCGGIVHHGQTDDGDREVIRKSLEPAFDPFFAVDVSLAEHECAAEAPEDAVVPARYGHVDGVARAIVTGELRL